GRGLLRRDRQRERAVLPDLLAPAPVFHGVAAWLPILEQSPLCWRLAGEAPARSAAGVAAAAGQGPGGQAGRRLFRRRHRDEDHRRLMARKLHWFSIRRFFVAGTWRTHDA